MVAFARQLVDPVHVHRPLPVLLVHWHALGPAVDLAGAGEDDLDLGVVLAARLEEDELGAAVDLQVRVGVTHRVEVSRLPCEVEEEVLLLPYHYRIHQSKGPYHYRFPKAWRKGEIIGQRQHYFHALLLSEEISLKRGGDTSDEFRSLRWIDPGEFQLKWLHPMKWEVYTQVFLDFFKMKIS